MRFHSLSLWFVNRKHREIWMTEKKDKKKAAAEYLDYPRLDQVMSENAEFFWNRLSILIVAVPAVIRAISKSNTKS